MKFKQKWFAFKVILIDKDGGKIEKIHAFNYMYEVLNFYTGMIAGGVYKNIENIVITKLGDF